MYIVDIVKNILEGMTYRETDSSDDSSEGVWKPLNSWIYQDIPTANIKFSSKTPSPVGLLMQLSSFDVDTDGMKFREIVEINVSFLTSERKLDAGAESQDVIVDDMFMIAREFINRVFDEKSIEVVDDVIHVKAVYLVSDSVKTGVNIAMTLRQKQSSCL